MKISAFSTVSRIGADHARGRGIGPWIKGGRGLRSVQVAVLVALMTTACVPHACRIAPARCIPPMGWGWGSGISSRRRC